MECKLYSKLYQLDTVTLRYFNVYSPDQKAEGPYATAVANWMKYVRQGKKPYITGDGEQRRDMLNVKDAVSANMFAMKHSERFNGAVFDVGTGKNISLNEIKAMVERYHPQIEFEYIEPRKGDVLLTKANEKPLKDLGWQTQILIEKGVTECFKNMK